MKQFSLFEQKIRVLKGNQNPANSDPEVCFHFIFSLVVFARHTGMVLGVLVTEKVRYRQVELRKQAGQLSLQVCIMAVKVCFRTFSNIFSK